MTTHRFSVPALGAALLTAVLLASAPATHATADGTQSAQAARTATVIAGVFERAGTLRSSGARWTVYAGSSARLGYVRRQGAKWVVYVGVAKRAGEVRRHGRAWVVYKNRRTRRGELRRVNGEWQVLDNATKPVGSVIGAGMQNGGPSGGAALLLLLT